MLEQEYMHSTSHCAEAGPAALLWFESCATCAVAQSSSMHAYHSTTHFRVRLQYTPIVLGAC